MLTLQQAGLRSLAGRGASGPVRRRERKEEWGQPIIHTAWEQGENKEGESGAPMPPFLDGELHLMELAGLWCRAEQAMLPTLGDTLKWTTEGMATPGARLHRVQDRVVLPLGA